MAGYIRSAGLITAFLIVFFPLLTLAEEVNFSVIPAEVHIDNLPPGETAEFELTIENRDEIARNFTVTTFSPPAEERRQGTADFPDDSWINFSSPEVEVSANFAANVTVTVAIPKEGKWAGQDWEIWLGVIAESSDLLDVELYVRMLVSTTSAAKAKFNAGLFVGIAVAAVLLGYGSYHYFRRRARPE